VITVVFSVMIKLIEVGTKLHICVEDLFIDFLFLLTNDFNLVFVFLLLMGGCFKGFYFNLKVVFSF
ncbi:hypothetical protein JVW21_21035, partial [Vibrio cholerae O1]|uniref:hypothetical protein n=1 Tax=Vibrio cholerae TaxID=666 RepID=UPI001C11A181